MNRDKSPLREALRDRTANREGQRALDALEQLGALLVEADEILADADRYLTEFGSVEPETLSRRIRGFRTEIAIERAKE